MTSLPSARVKSPVCEAMTLSFGLAVIAVGEALLPVDRRGRAGGALQLDDVHRLGGALVLLDEPLAGLLALLDEVGARGSVL